MTVAKGSARPPEPAPAHPAEEGRTAGPAPSVERVMQDIEAAARTDRWERLVSAGGGRGYTDPALFEAVDRILQRAVERNEQAVLLPELLANEDDWQLQTNLRLSSHRPVIGPAIVFMKRRVLLPLMRWLFDYNRENARRQQQVNRLLAACIEEVALENARLRREVAGLRDGGSAERNEEGARPL